MSTIRLPTSDWFQRGTRTATSRDPKRRIRHLIRMLTGDAQRPRPPVTLAGQHSNGNAIAERAPLAPPSNARPKWTPPAHGHSSRSGIPDGIEPTDADGEGPYSYSELVRMNYKFIHAVERAFRNGGETQAAASASYDPKRERRASLRSQAQLLNATEDRRGKKLALHRD